MGKNSSALWLVTCVIVTLLAVILVHPVLDSGFNDDWSYVRMAERFANTGHITYDGWTQPMGVPLTVIGGILVRLFGFSYLVLRLSVLPFFLGSMVMVWLIGRRIGLPASLASLVSLSVVLSPVAIPLGVAFSTDLPAAALTILAAYCAMRGEAAEKQGTAMAWLCGAAVTGILAGMNRQIFWAAPPILIGAVAYLRRGERSFALGAIALIVVTVAISTVAMEWHARQPGIRENSIEIINAHGLGIAKKLVKETVQLGRTLLLLMLPILVLFLARAGALRRKILFAVAGFTILFGVVGYFRPHVIRAPWMGNLFTEFGPFYPREVMLGLKPSLIPHAVQVLLALLVCASAASATGFAWQFATSSQESIRQRLDREWNDHKTFWAFALATVPFFLLYFGMLVFRSLSFANFDRYMAAIVAFPALFVAWFWHRLATARSSAIAGWIVVALFAAFGTAATHDIFAVYRARLAAADWVTAHEVPRRCLTAGYEYDGDTQLLAQGTLVDDLASLNSKAIDFWFFEWTPAIQPCMYVVLTPEPKLGPFATKLPYSTWLSPRQRVMLVQRGPQPCPASCTRPQDPGYHAGNLMEQSH